MPTPRPTINDVITDSNIYGRVHRLVLRDIDVLHGALRDAENLAAPSAARRERRPRRRPDPRGRFSRTAP